MADLSRIRDFCKEKDLTLKELASKLDITETAIQKIIRTNSTKIETLENIANILGVPISDFFDHNDKIFTFLKQYNFKVVNDTHGTIAENRDLYYREISDHRKSKFKAYLLFSHYNKGRLGYLQGFDLWIAIYASEKEIGNNDFYSLISLAKGVDINELSLAESLIIQNK